MYYCNAEIVETDILFDADSNNGYRGKQIHKKLANVCKQVKTGFLPRLDFLVYGIFFHNKRTAHAL